MIFKSLYLAYLFLKIWLLVSGIC